VTHSHQANLGPTARPKYGAFQLYTVAKEGLAAPIPDNLSYEEGTVLPLAVSTAAYGLYLKDLLNLPLPSTSPNPGNKTLLVWGAASSVGSCVVQFATASGVNVVGVASKRNHDYVKSLGAKEVLDYHDASVVDDAAAALKKGEFVGIYDAICEGETLPTCIKVAQKMGGAKIATSLPPYGDVPDNVQAAMCKCTLPSMGLTAMY
jgi:NADPH:quinone reductase-like Zn-dependent oxidoreductase